MTALVVAGLDGSPESLAAADWAAREALRRGAPLRLLHAWQWQPSTYAVPVPVSAADTERHWAEKIPREAAATLRERYPELDVSAHQVAAQPATALLSAAEHAGLLVLGSRGLGAVAGFLVGSVAFAVLARAELPVVLVRAGATAKDGHLADTDGSPSVRTAHRDVVLGLDLERPDAHLIEYAFDAAGRRGATLRVVHGWNPPAIYGYSPAAADPELGRELAAHERDALTEALRPWCEKFPTVRVTAQATVGSAAQHLVEASRDASLLVVGRRTRGPGVGPHLGPVTRAVLHHAAAPLVIVPHD